MNESGDYLFALREGAIPGPSHIRAEASERSCWALRRGGPRGTRSHSSNRSVWGSRISPRPPISTTKPAVSVAAPRWISSPGQAGMENGLFEGRRSERLFVAVVLATYVVLTLWAALHHEAWLDEADPWLLMRDGGIVPLLSQTAYGYRGTPVLWFLAIWPFAAAGAPYLAQQLVNLAFASAAVLLFLRGAPFSRVVKALFALSYYAAFEYSVIPRPYALLMLLLFSMAALWLAPRGPPGGAGGGGGALANATAHGLLVAAVGGLILLLELDPSAPSVEEVTGWPDDHDRRRSGGARPALAADRAVRSIRTECSSRPSGTRSPARSFPTCGRAWPFFRRLRFSSSWHGRSAGIGPRFSFLWDRMGPCWGSSSSSGWEDCGMPASC